MEEKTLLEATLCFLCKDNKVLLARKMKKIGQGCWNGYGGGIEPGEIPEQAACRELYEESGISIDPEDLEKMAQVDFHNTKTDGSVFTCRVYVYRVKSWKGDVQATDEMAEPTWFDVDALPLDDMMPADKEWVPSILQGKKIIAEAWYGPFQKSLLKEVMIKEVDNF